MTYCSPKILKTVQSWLSGTVVSDETRKANEELHSGHGERANKAFEETMDRTGDPDQAHAAYINELKD